MIFWLVTLIIVVVVMMVISILIHGKYHKKNAIGRCAYCNKKNCKDDHHFVEVSGAESCPLYNHSLPYWVTRIVIVLALFSPAFLEFNKLGLFGTSYTFNNGEYKKIRFAALDIPGVSNTLTVPTSTKIYTDSQIIAMNGNRVRVLTPSFGWQYDQSPEVFGEIPDRPTFTMAENKPILEFILRNESVLRMMISRADIESSDGRDRLLEDIQKLVRSDINVHGYKFDLLDFTVYEH